MVGTAGQDYAANSPPGIHRGKGPGHRSPQVLAAQGIMGGSGVEGRLCACTGLPSPKGEPRGLRERYRG